MDLTRMQTSHLGILLLMVVMMPHLSEGCGRGSIYLMNNGYKQVLIAVGEDVPDNPTLIDSIKDAFTRTSALLYNATRQRAYLQEINILVPKTWANRPEYELAGDEAIDKSDILVDKPDTRFNQGDAPFVIKSTPCGELGHYMHITPDYLLEPRVSKPFGPSEKVLVHEWAHLRYGVFDEYPTGNDPHFYNGPGGKVEATRCSALLEGETYDKVTNDRQCASRGSLPDGNCRFRDFEEELLPEYASLMYRQFLDHIVSFCDNDPNRPKDRHNGQAPNQQNKKCGGRSVWEVLRSHGDFDGVNPPRNISDTTPKFRVLQAQVNRYVLVLDISGSMGQPRTRIENLGRGCSNFITNVIRDGEKLGIVWFNSQAVRAYEMTKISNQTRRDLLDGIPDIANGGTSIGAGIRAALAMLRDDGGTKGASLIVVSDGQENRPPRIPDVTAEVMASQVTVHAIAFTNKASVGVDALAKATGGLSFLYTDREQSNALNEAFRTIADLNQNIKDKKLPLSSEAQNLASGATFRHQVSIDSTLGRNTEFIFDYGGTDIDVILTSPKGLSYDKNSPLVTHDTKFGIYTFAFTGVGETGRWSYNVTNPDLIAQKVAITVVSQTAQEGKYPIIAQSFWGKREINHNNVVTRQAVYASVSQGYSPVLSANVVAQVETPSGGIVELPLYDSGAGADQTKDDGIYSAYFVRFSGNGRYNVKVIVNSVEATRISSIRVIGKGAADPDSVDAYDEEVKVTDLERTTSGGSFELSNYRAGKVYLPGQVTDMELDSVDFNSREVTLSWTAPGAEMDVGTVSMYEIRYGTNFDSVSQNFTSQTEVTQSMIRVGNLSDPRPAGQIEVFRIQVPLAGDVTYLFAMVAKDTAGRNVQSELSNLVSAGMRAYEGRGTNKTPIIVGAIFGSLVFVAIVVVLAIAFRRIIQTKKTSNFQA